MNKKKYSLIIITLIIISIIGIWNLEKSNNKLNVEKEISEDNKEVEMQEMDSVKDFANNFKLNNLEGKEISLNDFKGKNVLLNFWNSSCPPCIEEMEEFQKIHDEFKDENLEIVTINVGEDEEVVRKIFEENKYAFECLLDKENKVTYEYNITSVPTTYTINKNGEIEGIFNGYINYDTIKGIKTVLER